MDSEDLLCLPSSEKSSHRLGYFRIGFFVLTKAPLPKQESKTLLPVVLLEDDEGKRIFISCSLRWRCVYGINKQC